MDRREFIKTGAAAAFVMSLGQQLNFVSAAGGISYRLLGHTGEKVSLLGIDGAH